MKGFRRLWVVLTALWVLFMYWLVEMGGGVRAAIGDPSVTSQLILVVAIPPAIVYALGAAVAWVYRGFLDNE